MHRQMLHWRIFYVQMTVTLTPCFDHAFGGKNGQQLLSLSIWLECPLCRNAQSTRRDEIGPNEPEG